MSSNMQDPHPSSGTNLLTIQGPPTSSTPTQASCKEQDNTLSARILEEIEHSAKLFRDLYQGVTDKEQKIPQLECQLRDKTGAVESWRKWFDEHKAEIAESHERNLRLENQNEKLQQDVDSLNAHSKELEEEKTKIVQEREAQHHASLVPLRELHSRQVEDIAAMVTDLSRDAVELREGFTEHHIEVDLLRSGKERAERELQDAVRNCNKAVESENQFSKSHIMYRLNMLLAGALGAAGIQFSQSNVPDYFLTSPEAFAGPTATGAPAFLAQTNRAPFEASYIPPQPLETQIPIKGTPPDGNIYQLQGQLSHYFPNPQGFGVHEYPLAEGAEITQLHMIQRHGSRYPETGTLAVLGKFFQQTQENSTLGAISPSSIHGPIHWAKRFLFLWETRSC